MTDRIAASATQAAVQTAVNAAVDGDRVLIPNSSGANIWSSGISTTKRIIIQAQNYTPTARPTTGTARNVTITYTGTTAPCFSLTTGNDFHCGIGGIKFLPPVAGEQSGGSGIWGYINISGSGTKPVLIYDCHIVGNERQGVTSGEASFISLNGLGGVIWNTLFDGTQVPDGLAGGGGDGMSGAGIHLVSPRSWATASTMGTLDTNGLVNAYFEDCHMLWWGQADGDDNARIVIRHTTINGCSWQTHGFTSTFGGRHFEVYACDLINTVDNRNHNRYNWIRAGTALFTGNVVSNQNTGYGTPGLVDIGDNTTPSGGYPVDRAPGRGHNGTAHVSDPIYVWNNTGGSAQSWSVDAAWTSHVQLNRDIFVSGVPGTAKPSTAGSPGAWASYTYPHPLRSVVEGGSLLAAPTNLRWSPR